MAEDTTERIVNRGLAGAEDIRLQSAQALEEAARRLRNADVSVNAEDVKSILHGVQNQVDQYREELGVKYHEIEAEYQRQVEPVENIICDHPIPAVVVAAGFGFLLGMLICRARD